MDIPVGHAHHFQWLKGVIAAIFALNVVDGVLTLYWIFTTHAAEANPLMDRLIHIDPVLFMIGKLSLVVLGSLLLWRLRRNALAVTAIFALFLVYYFLLLHHLYAMDLHLLERLFP